MTPARQEWAGIVWFILWMGILVIGTAQGGLLTGLLLIACTFATHGWMRD